MMFGSVMLDVAIGMVVIFLLLSLIAAAVREGIEGWLKMRSTFLERGIGQLLHDPGLVAAFYAHPQVAALYRGNYDEARKARELPSYIPSRNFALALLDLIVRGRDISAQTDAGPSSPMLSVATLRQNVARIQIPAVQRVVLSAIDVSAGDLGQVQAAVEAWFNSAMDRVSGWYKRVSAQMLLAIGVVIAVVTNVDAIRVARSLYHDPARRQAAVAMAGSIAQAQPAVARQVVEELDRTRLPIGWPDDDWPAHWYLRIVGWLMTAFAISLGGPFWFDLLSTFLLIRSTVKPRTRSEGSVTAAPVPLASTTGRQAVAVRQWSSYEPHEWASGPAQAGTL
jgi:hypothetical protein